MSKEIELKLALAPTAPARLVSHPLLKSLKRNTHMLGNTYFDTPKRDLERARIALRVRRFGENQVQTLKSAAISEGGLSKRGEWEWSIDNADLNAQGLDIAGIEALKHEGLEGVDLASLRPVFQTDFERHFWLYQNGDTAIEIALDQGSIKASDRQLPICELELELKHGSAESLWQLAAELCQITPELEARPANQSKASRANQLRSGFSQPENQPTSIDTLIDALDSWHDSQEIAWLDQAKAHAKTLHSQQPSAEISTILDALERDQMPWQSTVWLSLRQQ